MDVKEVPGATTKSYVVEGATLKCSLGSQTCKLKLLPVGHGVYIRGKKQANVGDKKPMLNIAPFGNCLMASPPPPCIPSVVMDWINGKMNVDVESKNALLDTSMAFCARGGVITITDDGQQ